jgi:ribosomal protein L24
MLRSWETIGKLRDLNPEGKTIRQGDCIAIQEGNYKGKWRIVRITDNQKSGALVGLTKLDGCSVIKDNVIVKSLQKAKLEILPKSLI